MASDFRRNNFDLIRLLAAIQVVLYHGMEHLQIEPGRFVDQLFSIFPGVPIFFFTSGLLISKSYEKNPQLGSYFRNRGLRIYPALWCCFVVSVTAVLLTGFLEMRTLASLGFVKWAAAQLSFVQFYNPDFMREFGVGTLNGSLWTIVVELQFYILIPLVYLLSKGSKRGFEFALCGLCIGFALIGWAYSLAHPFYSGHVLYKLAGVSFIPWFYMFIVGILVQRHFEWVSKLLHGRGLYCLGIYIAVALAYSQFGIPFGNRIGPLPFLLLAATTFSLAYTNVDLSKKILNHNDISYGVYIYHMPIINLFIFYELGIGSVPMLGAVLMITLAMGWLSWKLIEKPTLAMKKHSLYPVKPASEAPKEIGSTVRRVGFDEELIVQRQAD